MGPLREPAFLGGFEVPEPSAPVWRHAQIELKTYRRNTWNGFYRKRNFYTVLMAYMYFKIIFIMCKRFIQNVNDGKNSLLQNH